MRSAPAPFDRIIATASSWAIPAPWCEQLAPDGLLELPLWTTGAVTFPQIIATFRRSKLGLDSVRTFPGGFMGVRHRRDDPAPAVPRAALTRDASNGPTTLVQVSASWFADSTDDKVIQVVGAVLGALPTTAAVRPPIDGANVYHLFVFLSFAVPDSMIVSARLPGGVRAPFGDDSLGVWHDETRTVAVLGGSSSAIKCVHGHGDSVASQRLQQVLAEWDALDRPTVEQLRLGVRFGAMREHPPRSWRAQERGDGLLLIDWN